MTIRFPGARARMAVLLSAVIMFAVVGFFASELLSRYRWANEVIASIEPRYARLIGLEEVGDAVLTSRVRVDVALARVAYPAEIEIGRIGTDLQQRVRRIADEHDIRVSGSQILPLREEKGFVVVTVNGTMDSEVDALGTFLLALADEQPPIVVEKLLVQAPRPGRRGEVNTRVTVQSTMSVIRLLP